MPTQRERNEVPAHIKLLLRMIRDFCLGIARWIDQYYIT